MQYHLVGGNVLALTNIAYHLPRQRTAFDFIDLPTDDLPAEDVHEQVEIKIDSLNLGRQVGDVPAEQLARCCCRERPRLAARFRRSVCATVLAQIRGFEHAVEG